MNKNLLRSILLIITYSVVLVLVLVKIDLIWAVAAQILGALKPLFLGFAIAFVLNRPCTFFFRLYHGGLAGRKLDRFSRPLAVLSAYVALVVVVTALFSFVLPQVADSIRLFVSSLSGYMANLQALADEVFALFDREGVDFSSLNEYLRRVLEGVLNTATNAASHVLVITSGVISMGVTLVLAIGATLNLAVVMGMAPPKGVAMPFLSYGGSSLLASMMCIGLLLNFSRTAR